MPFRKLPSGNYVSESGRKYTPEQLKLYYATDGFKHKPKKSTRRRKPKGRT